MVPIPVPHVPAADEDRPARQLVDSRRSSINSNSKTSLVDRSLSGAAGWCACAACQRGQAIWTLAKSSEQVQ
jgi:hypothetical protein